MRLDHLAYRTADRWKTADFFIEAFGYKVQEEFQPYGDDSVNCVALVPSEKRVAFAPFVLDGGYHGEYHLAPEIFISDGAIGSIVWEWVMGKGGIGGIHHLAYQVDDVAAEMKRWKDNGWGNFLSDGPLTCPGIDQVFSEEMRATGGIIYEFIKRGSARGFCKDNVRALMDSTKGSSDQEE